jgi:hypothetical protein
MKLWPEFLKTLTGRGANDKLYLIPAKVRQWFESMFKRANVEQLQFPGVLSV